MGLWGHDMATSSREGAMRRTHTGGIIAAAVAFLVLFPLTWTSARAADGDAINNATCPENRPIILGALYIAAARAPNQASIASPTNGKAMM